MRQLEFSLKRWAMKRLAELILAAGVVAVGGLLWMMGILTIDGARK